MHSVLSSLPYTYWGPCLSLKLQPVQFKLRWFERGKHHTYTRQKSLNKSQESYRAGSSGEPRSRRKVGLLSRGRGAGTALPAPRGARPRPPSRPPPSRAGDTCRLVGVDAMVETRGGSPGRAWGGGRQQGDVDSHLERPERTRASGLEPRGCLPLEPVRRPPGTQTAPDPPHGASAIPAPRAGLASRLCRRTSAFAISTRPTPYPAVAVSPSPWASRGRDAAPGTPLRPGGSQPARRRTTAPLSQWGRRGCRAVPASSFCGCGVLCDELLVLAPLARLSVGRALSLCHPSSKSHWWRLWAGYQFSRSVGSGSVRPHGLQDARPPCPSPTPGVHSNSCSSSR